MKIFTGKTYILNVIMLAVLMTFAGSELSDEGFAGYADQFLLQGDRLDGEKEVKLMDFAASGLYGRNRDSLIPDGKGGFVGALYEGKENLFHLTLYAKADASQTKERKILTFATTRAGDVVEKTNV